MTHHRAWSVAQAKSRLAQVLDDAGDAPQVIERRGKEVAVVLGAEAFHTLAAQAAAASPEPRWTRFLALSAEIRAQGGADLVLPRRTPRPSPFGPRRR